MASAFESTPTLAQPVEEDPVAEQQLLHVGIDPGKAVEHRLDPVEHAVVEVVAARRRRACSRGETGSPTSLRRRRRSARAG